MQSIRGRPYGKEKRRIDECRQPIPGQIRRELKAVTAVSTANWQFDRQDKSIREHWESYPQWVESLETSTNSSLPSWQISPMNEDRP